MEILSLFLIISAFFLFLLTESIRIELEITDTISVKIKYLFLSFYPRSNQEKKEEDGIQTDKSNKREYITALLKRSVVDIKKFEISLPIDEIYIPLYSSLATALISLAVVAFASNCKSLTYTLGFFSVKPNDTTSFFFQAELSILTFELLYLLIKQKFIKLYNQKRNKNVRVKNERYYKNLA